MVSLDLGKDGILDVYTTHLHAGSDPAVQVARLAQKRQMAEFIKANSPEAHSVILMGDMNSRPPRGPKVVIDQKVEAEKVENKAFQELLDTLKLKNAQDVLFGPVKLNIDHVMYRPGKGKTMTPLAWSEEVKRFVNKKGAWLSDHPPVLVKFDLKTK